MLDTIQSLHQQKHSDISIELKNFDKIKQSLKSYSYSDLRDKYENSKIMLAILQESLD